MSASVTPDLADADTLTRLFAPVAGEQALGLAVSGGPDSLALMLLAQRWAVAQAQPPRLFVYSLDHGLRPEAASEVAMVLAEAERLGLTARGLVWEGPAPETGVLEAARLARYRLIGEAMAADGVTVLAAGQPRGDE